MKQFVPYLSYLKPVLILFICGIFLGLLHGLLSGFGLPFMIYQVFPHIFSDDTSTLPAQHLLFWCAVPPLVFLLRGLCDVLNFMSMTYCETKVQAALRLDVFRHVLDQQLGFFARNTTGDLLARINGDTAVLATTLTGVLNQLMKQPITLLSAMGALLYLSIKHEESIFLLFCLLSIPVCILPIRYAGKNILRRARHNATYGSDLHNIVADNLIGVKDIRAFCLEEHQAHRLQSLLQKMIRTRLKLARYSRAISPLIEVISATGISITLYFAAYDRGITPEVFIPLVSALYFSYSPIKSLGRIHSRIRTGQVSLERLEYILNHPVSIEDPTVPRTVSRLQGNVRFQHVTFSYTSQPVLTDVHFDITAGTTVALVGPSGAGKTTVTNLLMRFYDTRSGAVMIDGINVKEVRKSDLRQNIALVPQEPFLFNDTIYHNILLGNLQASQEMVYEASRSAYADEFIKTLPRGYDTRIGDRGLTLSGGQRQRLALARAFLRNAPILILDEATSALDSESERMVHQACEALVKDKTVLIIAHRFSTLRLAEHILLLAGGRLLAQGSHDGLYHSSAVYRNLYDQQHSDLRALTISSSRE